MNRPNSSSNTDSEAMKEIPQDRQIESMMKMEGFEDVMMSQRHDDTGEERTTPDSNNAVVDDQTTLAAEEDGDFYDWSKHPMIEKQEKQESRGDENQQKMAEEAEGSQQQLKQQQQSVLMNETTTPTSTSPDNVTSASLSPPLPNDDDDDDRNIINDYVNGTTEVPVDKDDQRSTTSTAKKKKKKKKKKKHHKEGTKKHKKRKKRQEPDGVIFPLPFSGFSGFQSSFHVNDVFNHDNTRPSARQLAPFQDSWASYNVSLHSDKNNNDIDNDDNPHYHRSSSGRISTASSVATATTTNRFAFLDDDPNQMTYQRRFAMYLMKKKWYNPQYDPEDDISADSEESDAYDSDSLADYNEEAVESMYGRRAESCPRTTNTTNSRKSRYSTSGRNSTTSRRHASVDSSGSVHSGISGRPSVGRYDSAAVFRTRGSMGLDSSVLSRKKSDGASRPSSQLSSSSSSSSSRGTQQEELFIDRKPSLAKAWAYFEHNTLQRYVVDDDTIDYETKGFFQRVYAGFFQRGRPIVTRAAPGTTTRRTKLYDPISTTHKQLGSFGQGVALYFSTLLAVAALTFVAGLASSYSMYYYASGKYDANSDEGHDLPLFQRMSAVCTDTSWVPCPDCDCRPENNQENFEAQKEWEIERCVILDNVGVASQNFTVTGTVGSLTFALKNNCDGAVWSLAAPSYVAVILVYFGVMLIGVYLDRAEIYFDEVEQTAQDYSITIRNPPPDANDPSEWKNYFQNNCDGVKVAVCTCALDNDLLVQALVDRRATFRKLQHSLPKGHPMDVLSLAHAAAQHDKDRSILQRLMALSHINLSVPEYFANLVVLNARIQALAQLQYQTTRVFVTFEIEADQRHVLEKLTVGSALAKKNDGSRLSDKKYLFRDKHVLDVVEAKEPGTVLWETLNVHPMRKLRRQIISLILMGVAIFCCFLVIRFVHGISFAFTALTISAFNKICPAIAKGINSIEPHHDEGSRQKALYIKIAAFRWINTVVVISLVTPFTSYLEADGGLIPQVYAVFYSELVTLSIVQLCDFGGHFQRHFLAPRADNQDAMNLYFEGEHLDIAERYTNTAKILFLALWYSAIYPPGFFLCSFAMIVNYFLDRFSLMRTWKRAARLGAEMSQFSRKYFFSVSNIVMAVFTAFYFSAFPYDNLCDTGETVAIYDPSYAGNFTLSPQLPVPWITKVLGNEDSFKENLKVNVTIDANYPVYSYCKQDFLSPEFFFTFPFLPKDQEKGGGEWMTPTQEQITTVLGWTSLAIVLAVFLRIVYNAIQEYLEKNYGTFTAVGEDQKIPYSDIPNPGSYIPEVRSKLFSYPLLVCDIDTFDYENLIQWKDPNRDFAYYDLTKDTEALLEGTEFSKEKCFSRVAHWHL